MTCLPGAVGVWRTRQVWPPSKNAGSVVSAPPGAANVTFTSFSVKSKGLPFIAGSSNAASTFG